MTNIGQNRKRNPHKISLVKSVINSMTNNKLQCVYPTSAHIQHIFSQERSVKPTEHLTNCL
jgi:hypothetical protein